MPDELNDSAVLPAPARYFPIRNERYSTGAGLFRFGHDFGNTGHDQKLFQFDHHFPRYYDNICAVRQARIQPFYCHSERDLRTEQALSRFLCQQLAREHPRWFQLHEHTWGYRLICHLSSEQLRFSHQGRLLGTEGDISPPYQDSLDAIASQCQEDIALMSFDEHGRNRLSDIHLCAANHWCPQDMAGKNMLALHAKVPGFRQANPTADKLLAAICNKGPYLRFAWGIQADEQLNRHPTQFTNDTRLAVSEGEAGRLFLRIERQVLWPVPHCSRLLFTIRTYFLDCTTLSREEHYALQHSLTSMDDDSLAYKGIDRKTILNRLAALLVL